MKHFKQHLELILTAYNTGRKELQALCNMYSALIESISYLHLHLIEKAVNATTHLDIEQIAQLDIIAKTTYNDLTGYEAYTDAVYLSPLNHVEERLRDYILLNVYECGNKCCGENCPDFQNITKDNWIQHRNEFLRNVSYNGGSTHEDIITILEWFNQFN